MAGYGPSRGAAAATATSPRKHAASQLGRAKSAEREASFAAATSGHATSTWTIPSRPIPAAATPAASSLAAPAQQQQKECAVHILYLPHGAIQLLLFASQQPAPAADQTATATPAPAPAQPCTAIIPYPPRGALRLPCATPAAAAAPQHSTCQATASAPVSAAATLDLELSPEEVGAWLAALQQGRAACSHTCIYQPASLTSQHSLMPPTPVPALLCRPSGWCSPLPCWTPPPPSPRHPPRPPVLLRL